MESRMIDEPVIHSHISDALPKVHPLAYEEVGCCKCNCMVHAFNNECMCAWFEWLDFAICFDCFVKYCYNGGLVSVPGFMVKAN